MHSYRLFVSVGKYVLVCEQRLESLAKSPIRYRSSRLWVSYLPYLRFSEIHERRSLVACLEALLCTKTAEHALYNHEIPVTTCSGSQSNVFACVLTRSNRKSIRSANHLESKSDAANFRQIYSVALALAVSSPRAQGAPAREYCMVCCACLELS